jgi:hypothetical protein
MTERGDVDNRLLQEALDAVAANAEDVSVEPAILAGFELNRASVLIDAGRFLEAAAIYRQMAAGGRAVPSARRLEAAIRWADLAFARETWNEVVEAQRRAVAHVDDLRSSQSTWWERYAWSGTSGKLAAMAAFALAKTGSAAAATAVLEEGRTMMLAERLGLSSTSAEADARVVHLLATTAGGLAVVSGGSSPGVLVWLDKLGAATFLDRLESYTSALEGFRRNSGLGFETFVGEVAEMVTLLGDALEPLIVALDDDHLILVPVGVMTLLPISAALLCGLATHRSVTTLPSLRLGRGRPTVTATDGVLVVADLALPSARWEQAGVRGFFSASETASVTSSVAEIMNILPSGGVVHFACHAEANPGVPLDSGVDLPSGHRLTVAQILEADLQAVRMVVLSSCETGLPDPYGLDEGITLPAALLAAGCGGVVSTLWLVEDMSCTLLMLRFYWEFCLQRTPGPLALARAQRWQRSTSDSQKCDFIDEHLIRRGVLDAAAGGAMLHGLRRLSTSMAQNSFEEPYYWAGFCFSGR